MSNVGYLQNEQARLKARVRELEADMACVKTLLHDLALLGYHVEVRTSSLERRTGTTAATLSPPCLPLKSTGLESTTHGVGREAKNGSRRRL